MELDKRSIVILIVDDDPGHRLLVRENLEGAGVVNNIVELKDGQEAIDYIFREGVYAEQSPGGRPGLILLDINMPRKDGFAVLERVKSDEELRSIPILMLTSTDDQGEIDRCYALGANGYIVKPVDYDDFQQKIRTLGLYLDIVRLPR